MHWHFCFFHYDFSDNCRIPIDVIFNIVLLDLPWEPNLVDTESDEHEELIVQFTNQVCSFYDLLLRVVSQVVDNAL